MSTSAPSPKPVKNSSANAILIAAGDLILLSDCPHLPFLRIAVLNRTGKALLEKELLPSSAAGGESRYWSVVSTGR
jgi:hypothetical protein